jgi:hypothetical protein
MTMRFGVATFGAHVRVGLASVVLIVMRVVMGGAAEEVHAAEAAHPDFLAADLAALMLEAILAKKRHMTVVH